MKMNTTTKLLSIATLSLSLFFLNSCKKKDNEVDTETQSVVDNSICEQEFMQIQPTTNNLAINTKGTGAKKVTANSFLLAACDTLVYISGDTTYANLSSPPKWQFSFTSCSAANHDGVVRTGTILVTFLGKPKTAGSKAIIKMLNYKVNNNITYACDSIVVTTQASTSTTKGFQVEIINGVCTGGTGWTIKYSSNKTITMNNNGTPLVFVDDFTTVSGTSNGTNREGRNFSVTINSIIKPLNCKWITSGSLDLTPEGLSKRTVDYGNGTCDDDATYTVNGQTIAFKLK